MEAYRHILKKGELRDGRIYIAEIAVEEAMRSLGPVRNKPFNIFRSDGKLLVRSAQFQHTPGRGAIRLNCGQDAFAECTEGTPVWLRLRSDWDVEIEIGSSPGPIADPELTRECGPILEDPQITNYWQAVNVACLILETRLHNASQAPSEYTGVKVADYALRPSVGVLVCRDHGGEQEGVYFLCRGVLQALRNPGSHKKQHYPRNRARQVVGLVDFLLEEIGSARVRNAE